MYKINTCKLYEISKGIAREMISFMAFVSYMDWLKGYKGNDFFGDS